MLLAPVVFVVLTAAGVDVGQHKPTAHDRRVDFITAVVLAVAYYGVLLAAWNGQTVGKRLLRIRVVTELGLPLTFGQAVWREAGPRAVLIGGYLPALWPQGATFIVVIFLVDVISPLLQPENRAIHDLLSGTRVVLAGSPAAGGRSRQ